jgi:NAD(P)-dependent dehydrogenase (short-subunit alcohol dehydrogenase family)
MIDQPTTRPVALLTGASRGIGAAAARELARRGYALALAARSADDLQALAAELSAAGSPALPIPTDLRRPEEVQRLARLAIGHFGRVDALVNNAGIGGAGRRLARLTDEDVESTLATNLYAPIALTRALLPGMLERRRGAIIFIASIAAHIGLPASSLYCTSKFGLRGFALALRRELLRSGVGVTIVSPGFINTDMTTWLRGVPKAPPELVARAIADAIVRPRREVVTPSYYRLAIWLERALPWLADAALARRGR